MYQSPIADAERLRLIRLPAVLALTGLSRSEIYRRVGRDEFPQPIKIGPSTTAWAAHEIEAWIAERIAVRDQGGAQCA